VIEGRTFLAAAAATASTLAIKSAKADQLPLGDLPNWRYPGPWVEVLDKKFNYSNRRSAKRRLSGSPLGSAGLRCSRMASADPKEDGVRCDAPSGDLIGKMHLSETCTNLCFGGKKRNRLFVCGSTSIYAVYVETQGALLP
jgi:hypothetical protein